MMSGFLTRSEYFALMFWGTTVSLACWSYGFCTSRTGSPWRRPERELLNCMKFQWNNSNTFVAIVLPMNLSISTSNQNWEEAYKKGLLSDKKEQHMTLNREHSIWGLCGQAEAVLLSVHITLPWFSSSNELAGMYSYCVTSPSQNTNF